MPRAHSIIPARAVAAASIAVACLAPGIARADAGETEAESLFRQAQERMAQRDLNAACDLFARSLAAEAALGTLLNLATCHEKQGKSATAWSEFSKAEAQATAAGDGPRAGFARAHLATLERGLHRVVIEILAPVPGMRVTLDGKDLPREALGTALPLDPGEHRLDVAAGGKLPFTRTLNLGPSAGTDRIEVVLEPAPATSAAGPRASVVPAPAPNAPGPRAWMRPTGFAVGGLGLVGLGVAVAFGVQMAKEASQRDKLCPPGAPCSDPDAFAADHSARVDRLGMLVAGGVSVAALGAGAALVIVSRGGASAASPVALTPLPAPGAAGLGVRGVF